MPVDEIGVEFDATGGTDEEAVANQAAAEFCVPRQQLASFLARKGEFISEQDILAFSARLEIHPSIVIGQVQRKRNKYNWLRKYQTSIREHLLDWKYVDGWNRQYPTGL